MNPLPKKSIVVETAEVIDSNGKPYIPLPVSKPSDAYAATLHMILNHSAEMYMTIVKIICEKYSVTPEEMMNTICEHPAYKNMYVSPILHDLGYIHTDLPKKEEVPVASGEPETPAAAPTKKTLSPEEKARRAEKLRATLAAKKAAAAVAAGTAAATETTTAAAETVAEAAPAKEEAPAPVVKPKMVFKVKKPVKA